MIKTKGTFLLVISLLVIIATSAVYYFVFALPKYNNERINLSKESMAIKDKCYAYENKQCVSDTEKEIARLIPNNAILREVVPVPWSENNEYIGLYIENPIVADANSSDYLSCSGTKRGQTITGIYHLFTYANGTVTSNLIIPKSTSFDDYNSEQSAQIIGMAWKNTKENNFSYFQGKPVSTQEKENLEISNLINFKDYNGDHIPQEFILYGGEYFTCSDDENLIAGFDSDNHAAIMYKIRDAQGKFVYWDVNFIPKEGGNVTNYYGCGDHGSDQETTILYKYSPQNKYYYFVSRTTKQCLN